MAMAALIRSMLGAVPRTM